jgi:GGDEF domain-containing protein
LTAARQLEFESEGRKMDVSLSAGIGSTRGGDDVLFFDALLEAAENGLQVAQAAGGNRGETGVIGG